MENEWTERMVVTLGTAEIDGFVFVGGEQTANM